jgi:citronellol/citronellal dehydrogenase
MRYRSVFRPGLFDGQVVVVTGGGSGIGRCTAHELASLGAYTVLVGRNQEKLERTAAEIAEDGGESTFFVCDIRDEGLVQRTVAAIVELRGRIHGLVNNAGGQFSAPLTELTQKGFETVVRTNLVGGFLMAREVFAQSMHHHGGAIVNVTADYSRGIPRMGHSAAARAGMANLTRTAAIEWASSGVRVNAVGPGFVASSGYDTYGGDDFGQLLATLPSLTLARRHGTEGEVSAAIVFLLSEAAAYITGEELVVGGGAAVVNGLWPVPHHERLPPFQPFHRARSPRVLDSES